MQTDLIARLKRAVGQMESGGGKLAAEMRRVRASVRSEAVDELAPALESLGGRGGGDLRGLVEETIVLRTGRPVLAIVNHEPHLEFREAESEIWRDGLAAARGVIRQATQAVGRIDVSGHELSWLGTGWLVRDDVIVTNRHVASEFARRGASGFTFRQTLEDGRMSARVDFLHEVGRSETREFDVTDILHIEGNGGPDVALLRVAQTGGSSLASPIPLSRRPVDARRQVAVIGYPAEDARVPERDLMLRIFGNVFDRKRLAPGQILGEEDGLVLHDCSTLGGNSGSVVLDLETGEAVALHFSGRFLEANYAVGAATVADIVASVLGEEARPPASVQSAASSVATVQGGSISFTIPLTIRIDLGVPVQATTQPVVNVGQPAIAPPPKPVLQRPPVRAATTRDDSATSVRSGSGRSTSTWDDLATTREQLGLALDAFDWAEAVSIRQRLIERISGSADLMPASSAAGLLADYRKARRFSDMRDLAEALLESGVDHAAVKRQYAQSLIDDGVYVPARVFLELIARTEPEGSYEHGEALGLLGRLHKQLYVNAARPEDPKQQRNLRASIGAYNEAYKQDDRKIWHGINVVAVLARAQRDKVPLSKDYLQGRDLKDLAVLIRDEAREQPGDHWSAATEMEACVALGEIGEAIKAAERFVSRTNTTVRAFEVGSALRQLEEVWQLSGDGETGPLLDVLRDALLRHSGGRVTLPTKELGLRLQKNFDNERGADVKWLELALQRCRAIGRIERSGDGIGTGFLIDAKAFFGDRTPIRGPVLLTNWHVVNDEGSGAAHPGEVSVQFTVDDKRLKATRLIVGVPELDACFLELEGDAHALCPIRPPPLGFNPAGRQRLFVIGHPKGQGLSISLHDSYWLDTDGTRLHYRTPTDPGSSGSPVFDQEKWLVMALHRGGGEKMTRLNNKKGTYEANEGNSIDAIREAAQARMRQNGSEG